MKIQTNVCCRTSPVSWHGVNSGGNPEGEEYVWIPAQNLPLMSDFITIPIQSGLDTWTAKNLV